MSTGRRSRAEQQARTRRQLLDAAEEAFATRGYNGASMQHIADLAGFTQGALYANFSSKADLFLAVMDARANRHRDEARRFVEAAAPEAILRVGRDHAATRLSESREQDFRDVLVSLEFILFVVRERPDLREAVTARYRAAEAEMEALIAPLIEDRSADDPSAADLALAQSWMISGLGLRLLLEPDLIDPGVASALMDKLLTGGYDPPSGE